MTPYDAASEALARHFLADETWAGEPEVQELAQEIQDTIEDWIEGTRPAV
jgi:hypothetical protein